MRGEVANRGTVWGGRWLTEGQYGGGRLTEGQYGGGGG